MTGTCAYGAAMPRATADSRRADDARSMGEGGVD
jgi:hypothetical protein